jgi:hypothetical protein
MASALIGAVALIAFLGRSHALGNFLPAVAVLNALSLAEPDTPSVVHAVCISWLATVAAWLFILIPA